MPLVGVKACVVTVSVPDAGAGGAVTVTGKDDGTLWPLSSVTVAVTV